MRTPEDHCYQTWVDDFVAWYHRRHGRDPGIALTQREFARTNSSHPYVVRWDLGRFCNTPRETTYETET